MDTTEIRVAVVGCGAMAETVHLPALGLLPNVRVAAVVDTDLARAGALAQRFGVPVATADYRDAITAVDAAIIAVPHHIHAPITIDFLRGGVHVLVEKPMALNTRECDAMIEAADAANRLLAVGLLRRFNESLRFTKDLPRCRSARHDQEYRYPRRQHLPLERHERGDVPARRGRRARRHRVARR